MQPCYIPVSEPNPISFSFPEGPPWPGAKLAVCVTVYNEPVEALQRTLRALDAERADQVVVVVVDGVAAAHESALAWLERLGLLDRTALARPGLALHVFAGEALGLRLLLAIKPHNAGKLHSHLWFFNAFAEQLDPEYTVLVDVGTVPRPGAVRVLEERMDQDHTIGGICGELRPLSPDLGNPLVAAQLFEYKVSNLLDKSLESNFGFVSVLPGAFSAYRFAAIRGATASPLASYFRAITTPVGELGALRANMFLAEDRILCFELLARAGERWLVRYERRAVAETDVPEDLFALIRQRRRWLNGSFFAMLYILTNLNRFWKDTRHSVGRKLAVSVQFAYFAFTAAASWFIVGNFYLLFDFALEEVTFHRDLSALDALLGGEHALQRLLLYAYNTLIALQVLYGLAPRAAVAAGGARRFYEAVSVLYGAMAFLTLAVFALYVADNIASPVVLYGLTVFGAYLVAALFDGSVFVMLASALQFCFLLPTFLNVFALFAFCNSNDISWGTKDVLEVQLAGVPELARFARRRDRPYSSDGAAGAAQPEADARHDRAVDEYQRGRLRDLRGQNERADALFESFRSNVLLAMLTTNALLVLFFTNGDWKARRAVYFELVAYVTATLVALRLLGWAVFVLRAWVRSALARSRSRRKDGQLLVNGEAAPLDEPADDNPADETKPEPQPETQPSKTTKTKAHPINAAIWLAAVAFILIVLGHDAQGWKPDCGSPLCPGGAGTDGEWSGGVTAQGELVVCRDTCSESAHASVAFDYCDFFQCRPPLVSGIVGAQYWRLYARYNETQTLSVSMAPPTGCAVTLAAWQGYHGGAAPDFAPAGWNASTPGFGPGTLSHKLAQLDNAFPFAHAPHSRWSVAGATNVTVQAPGVRADARVAANTTRLERLDAELRADNSRWLTVGVAWRCNMTVAGVRGELLEALEPRAEFAPHWAEHYLSATTYTAVLLGTFFLLWAMRWWHLRRLIRASGVRKFPDTARGLRMPRGWQFRFILLGEWVDAVQFAAWALLPWAMSPSSSSSSSGELGRIVRLVVGIVDTYVFYIGFWVAAASVLLFPVLLRAVRSDDNRLALREFFLVACVFTVQARLLAAVMCSFPDDAPPTALYAPDTACFTGLQPLYAFLALALVVPYTIASTGFQIESQQQQTMFMEDPVYIATFAQCKTAVLVLFAVLPSRQWAPLILPCMWAISAVFLALNVRWRPCNIEQVNWIRTGSHALSLLTSSVGLVFRQQDVDDALPLYVLGALVAALLPVAAILYCRTFCSAAHEQALLCKWHQRPERATCDVFFQDVLSAAHARASDEFVMVSSSRRVLNPMTMRLVVARLRLGELRVLDLAGVRVHAAASRALFAAFLDMTPEAALQDVSLPHECADVGQTPALVALAARLRRLEVGNCEECCFVDALAAAVAASATLERFAGLPLQELRGELTACMDGVAAVGAVGVRVCDARFDPLVLFAVGCVDARAAEPDFRGVALRDFELRFLHAVCALPDVPFAALNDLRVASRNVNLMARPLLDYEQKFVASAVRRAQVNRVRFHAALQINAYELRTAEAVDLSGAACRLVDVLTIAAVAGASATLRELRLDGVGLDDAGLAAVARAVGESASLAELSLRDNNVVHCAPLFRLLGPLRSLDLSGNPLSGDDAPLPPHSLSRVRMDRVWVRFGAGPAFDGGGAARPLDVLAVASAVGLTSVDLSGCGLRDRDVLPVLGPGLVRLLLARNRLTDATCASIGSVCGVGGSGGRGSGSGGRGSGSGSSLEELDLEHNFVTEAGLALLEPLEVRVVRSRFNVVG